MLADSLPLSPLPHQSREVAIANFGTWQVAIPTDSNLVERQIFSAVVPVPERSYLSRGWATDREQMIANLEGLAIRPAVTTNSPANLPLRLGPGVPLDFELQSHQPLPTKIARTATMACSFGGIHYAVFRGIRPRFVRIYPFAGQDSVADAVRQLLEAERAFIVEHGDRLKEIPFYCESFDLG